MYLLLISAIVLCLAAPVIVAMWLDIMDSREYWTAVCGAYAATIVINLNN